MNTRQLIAAATLTLCATALPSIGMANSTAHSGDATSHVVEIQSKGTQTNRQTVLNALQTAQRNGEFNAVAGDSTPEPKALGESAVTRMSVIGMIKNTGHSKGDAS